MKRNPHDVRIDTTTFATLRELAWYRDTSVESLINALLRDAIVANHTEVIAAGRAFDDVQDFAYRPRT
jgi:hypothetical protein